MTQHFKNYHYEKYWGDQEMETAILCIERSQVAGLIQNSAEILRKHHLFV